jgi:two-component system NarL family response regulator
MKTPVPLKKHLAVSETSRPLTVLIADDHTVVRAGIRALLSTDPGLKVVGEAENGAKAVDAYARLLPDVVVMDLRMPIQDGVQATRAIRQIDPRGAVIILTTHQGDEEIHAALEAGAMGYILKNSPGDDLAAALRAVAGGKRWIPNAIAKKMEAHSAKAKLTDRELDVLQRLVGGDSNKELADKMGLTEHTVKAHLKNITAKLGVRDRTEAVTVGLRRGIIRLPE